MILTSGMFWNSSGCGELVSLQFASNYSLNTVKDIVKTYI